VALTPAQLKWIGIAANVSNNLLQNVNPDLVEINNLFNSEGGWSSTIQQGDLDLYPQLSGLTTAQLANALSVLDDVMSSVNGNQPQLAALAVAGGN
jgi:glutaredoxin 2